MAHGGAGRARGALRRTERDGHPGGSYYFGGLAAREPATQIEIRASWTPAEGPGGVPDLAAHLSAWCDLLCQVAGLPPAPLDMTTRGGIVPLPQRRGAQPR